MAGGNANDELMDIADDGDAKDIEGKTTCVLVMCHHFSMNTLAQAWISSVLRTNAKPIKAKLRMKPRMGMIKWKTVFETH